MNEKLLEEIEVLAGLMFAKTEIEIILDIYTQPWSVEYQRAYDKGRLQSEAKVRASIFEHAQNGSSPAQALAVKFIEDSKYRIDG